MKTLIRLVSPFKKLTSAEKLWSTVGVVILLLLLWTSSGHSYIPDPIDVIGALPRLVGDKDLFWHFQKSLFFCLKAMGYSVIISVILCYLSVLPVFSTFCEFLRKFRFLPSTGLSFLFMKISGNIDEQMLYMMMFGITTWMVYAMIDIALSITDDEVMYARSLRLNRWQSMREILIYGKAADLFNAAIGVFAIAWMLLAAVENIAKASGGIGVVLAESNKYFKMEEVYAIQFLILFTGIIIDFLLRKLRHFLFPYTNLK